jgi:hypothetical protein
VPPRPLIAIKTIKNGIMWTSLAKFGESDLIEQDDIITFPNKFLSVLDIASEYMFALEFCLFKESWDERRDASILSL